MQLPRFDSLEEAQEWAREYERAEPRLVGEVLFIIARVYKEDHGEMRIANLCAARAIECFDRCGWDTLYDCAARFVTILGKALPSIIHEGVVWRHFPDAKPYQR